MSGCDRGINHQSQHTHLGGNLIHRGSYVLELNLRFPDDAGLSLSRVAVILKYSDESSLAGLRERRAVAAASPAFLDDTYGLGPLGTITLFPWNQVQFIKRSRTRNTNDVPH